MASARSSRRKSGSRPPAQPTSAPWEAAPLALVVVAFSWTAASAAYRATLPAAVILLATLGVGILVASTAFAADAPRDPWRATRLTALLGFVACLLLAMNPKVADIFQLPKFTVLMLGAVVLGAMVAVERLVAGTPHLGLRARWPVLALLAWAAVTTIFSTSPRISLLGSYGSYDGLATLAALVVVYLVTAATVRTRDLRAVAVTLTATAGVVALYAVVQVHDRVLKTATSWDWNAWDPAQLAGNIFGFLGNPNHLGGFIAFVLPLAAAVAVVVGRLWVRISLGALAVVLLLELQRTDARGAVLGMLGGLLVFALTAAPPSVWRRGKLYTAAVCAGGAIALAAIVLVAAPRIGGSAGLFAGTSVVQRIEFAKSSLHMALDRPVAGQGPDTFNTQFGHYQTTRAYRLLGANERPDSPHNLFMSYMYGLGFPGLVALLVVLGTTTRQARRTWLALRAAGSASRTQAIMFSGVMAAGVATLNHLMFDVQRVVLSVQLWLVLGMIAATASEMTPPTQRVARRKLEPRATAAAVAAILIVCAFGAWVATRPLRSNANFQAANNISAAQRATNPRDIPSAESRKALEDAFTHADAAVRHNPWEAGYAYLAGTLARAIADVELVFKDPASNTTPEPVTRWLRASRTRLARAVALEPQSARFDQGYVRTLEAILANDPGDREAAREAMRARRLAYRYNPHRQEVAVELAQSLVASDNLDEALGVVRGGLASNPEVSELLRLAARIETRRGNKAIARSYWARLSERLPSDPEATAALVAP